MQAVILAAGESSRFWPLNQKHKSLVKIMGRSLLGNLIDQLKQSGIKDIIVVQSSQKRIQKELQDPLIKYAVQQAASGTGDSLLAAEKLINDDWFLLLNAEDVKDQVKPYFKSLADKRELTLFASRTKTPWLYGILETSKGRVVRIVEKPKPGKQPSSLKNDNIFWLPKNFFTYLKAVPSHPFSLIHALNLYAKKNPIRAIVVKAEITSLKFPWHILPLLKSRLLAIKSKKTAVKLGKNVVINGSVVIGPGTIIGSHTVVHGPCYIGRNCHLGDHNVIRGPVNLEDGVKTGAFMEIKNSLVGSGSHFHSGYLGDSIIGEDCRFGAGFSSANRRLDRRNIFSCVKGVKTDTGLTFWGAVIGDNVKIGINVGIMPGVLIGNNCVIGPGSIVFKNILDNTVFYQEFKDFVERKK